MDFLVDRFLEAERQGADVAMVSVMPRDRADVLTLLAATARADEKARIPLISMSVGPLGSVTRMVGGLFGVVPELRGGRGGLGPGTDPDRRPRHRARHPPPLARRRDVLTPLPAPDSRTESRKASP